MFFIMKRERLTNLKIFLANFFLARLLCALLIDEVLKILLEFENNDYYFYFVFKVETYFRSDERDHELSLVNRADRSERLEKLYRSLSLGPTVEQPINQNRATGSGSIFGDQSSISNVNISSLGAPLRFSSIN